MKVTVCELRNDPAGLEADWQALAAHVRSEKSDLVLLPEMAFHPWLAAAERPDAELWTKAVRTHDHWMDRLCELSAPIVVGTRPVLQDARRLNLGYIWQAEYGCLPVHAKYYLPDERGFWEASWYDRGEREFKATEVAGIRIGFLICTELWFASHAREYMHQRADLLVCPRVTPKSSVDKWLAGGRTAAVISGAFCLSSNMSGPNVEEIQFGGAGWIIEPEEGNVLAVTSRKNPFRSVEIELKTARQAKQTYPRYVPD